MSLTAPLSLHLLKLTNTPILQQLQIEEALLRVDSRNWCIINTEAPPAIVVGISGKPERLLNLPLLESAPIPVVRRFSGGGTVVVDADTLFVTLLFNSDRPTLPSPYPQPIMQWTEKLYQPVFDRSDFALRENDYTFGHHKFGGNAQYITKDRWLHHSTLLWDYSPSNMAYLTLPEKRPHYRESRTHSDFLCCMKNSLKNQYETCNKLVDSLISHLNTQFNVIEESENALPTILNQPHRKSTHTLDLQC